MARNVFFSFHYQRDIWRVNQIRSISNITGCSAAGFKDSSLWEEAKSKSDTAIKRLIDEGMQNTSVTVVCIGAKTAGRKYINYEIEQSMARGNGIVGIQIHNLEDNSGRIDSAGSIPYKLDANGYKVYKYVNHGKLANRIEEAARAAGR